MREPRLRRRHALARLTTAACLVGMATACSSGGGHSASSSATSASTTSTTVVATTTTLPSAQSIQMVKTWFAQHGAPLIQFERISAPFGTGAVPSAAVCLKFYETDLPRITKKPVTLVDLAQAIPNPDLGNALAWDVREKLLLGDGCGLRASQHKTFPASPEALREIRSFAEGARLWLNRFGIAI